MKNIQTTIWKRAKPHFYAMLAVELLLFIVVSPFSGGHASAGQLIDRSIQMSSSTPSSTNTVLKVLFSRSSTASVGGIVIDFCSNSALAYDTSCVAPTGFNANYATTTAPSGSQANLGTGAFSVYTTATGQLANKIILTRATPAALGASGSTFELGVAGTNGITLPSTTGSFYARIYTYDTAANAQSHSQTVASANMVDSGGIALTTNAVITITARVQENLSFCVSASAPTSNCGGTTAPALTIGHNPSGGTKYIDSTVVDTTSAYTQMSTNAGSGALVRMKNSNACGGLSTDGGTTCDIPPAVSGGGTAGAITAGTSAFGLYVNPGAAISGGSGTTTPNANYYNNTHTTIDTDLYYGMDSTTTGDNVTTPYGDSIMQSTQPVNNVNNRLVFAATASNLVAAGTYTANMTLIATGRF